MATHTSEPKEQNPSTQNKPVAYNRSQIILYLIWTFSIAYVIQAGVALLYSKGQIAIGQMLMSLMMFVPMLGVALSGNNLADIGWKPQIRKNFKFILIAWFSPAILTAIGAALYYLVFPGHFDLSGNYLIQAAGSEALETLKEQGISYPRYVLLASFSCITYAPLINMLFALGEEAGWRGFLYPQLKAGHGRKNGLLFGGIIWGMWHWPLIWLIGYEYGSEYFGYPVTGMLLFCIITIALGVFCDWLYERSGSIWLPALFHGAFNAAATIPLTMCKVDIGSARLLGPPPNGLIAGLPLIVAALVLLLRG
ncbi:MAG: type II CAAX endopeptidase family protein [Lachnospiraceae bacterium]|nr:type II CAAX endopeptidase family protein [Lachnospiraceae bacterium]